MADTDSVDRAVLEHLEAAVSSENPEGWVFADEILPLIPRGEFWEAMDRLKGRVVKATMPDENRLARMAFRSSK